MMSSSCSNLALCLLLCLAYWNKHGLTKVTMIADHVKKADSQVMMDILRDINAWKMISSGCINVLMALYDT